jgi:hypothetical protein
MGIRELRGFKLNGLGLKVKRIKGLRGWEGR